jgi:hypothetical protein
MAWIDPQ